MPGGVKLEVNQPDSTMVDELREVLAFYLPHPSVSQPVEYFHSVLLSCYHNDPVTLGDIQEEDPAVLRYITEDGRETVAPRFVDTSASGDLGAFVNDLKTELLAEQNCADEFVSIDANGHVAQCDCWITSYPDYCREHL